MALERDTVLRLLLRERAKILAYLHALLPDRTAAEDLFQEVSILALDRCGEIEHERHFLGWLRTAARWKALRAHEKQRAAPVSLDAEVLDLLGAEWSRLDEQPATALVDRLTECLQRLTPEARRLVELKYVEGKEGMTIAAQTGKKLRSVYTALSRVHRALATCLERSEAAELGDG
jgi:RNA polymerase sigma-70 factor (ECF subfamily)